MASVLAAILGMNEPKFSAVLHDLERASGRPGVDVRMIAEIAATVNRKTRELGLDPRDTTDRELFHALQSLTAQHDIFLANALSATDPADTADAIPRIADCANILPIPKNCWAIKPSIVKRFLKAHPPKKVMKMMGYRSIDSFLKRESVAEILCAARLVETRQWHEKYLKQYKKLKPGDFEAKDVEVMVCDSKKWEKLTAGYVVAHHKNITHLKEMGVVMLLPLPIDKMNGLYITLLPILLHYINEIRMYSAFFKLQQVKPDFGTVIMETLLHDPSNVAMMAGHNLHWKTVGKHFGRKKSVHPSVFEPHVQPEDLYYRKAEEVMYRIEPALKFWEGLDYVASVRDGHVISLNLLDNAVSYCNGLDYNQQARGHVQQSLWNELLMKYMSQESLEQEVLSQLSDELLETELVGIA